MEWKLEDLTLEQLKEISGAIAKEVRERTEKIELEHVKDLIHALTVCLNEDNSFVSGYTYLYSNEHCEEIEFELEEVLQTVLYDLKNIDN